MQLKDRQVLHREGHLDAQDLRGHHLVVRVRQGRHQECRYPHRIHRRRQENRSHRYCYQQEVSWSKQRRQRLVPLFLRGLGWVRGGLGRSVA